MFLKVKKKTKCHVQWYFYYFNDYHPLIPSILLCLKAWQQLHKNDDTILNKSWRQHLI